MGNEDARPDFCDHPDPEVHGTQSRVGTKLMLKYNYAADLSHVRSEVVRDDLNAWRRALGPCLRGSVSSQGLSRRGVQDKYFA